MPLSLTDRAPEVAMKTAGGAAARGDGALRRQPGGSAAESTAGRAPERTRFAAGGRKFGRWGSGLGQLFALAAGLREGAAGSASVLSQSAKMRSYIYYESLATSPRRYGTIMYTIDGESCNARRTCQPRGILYLHAIYSLLCFSPAQPAGNAQPTRARTSAA